MINGKRRPCPNCGSLDCTWSFLERGDFVNFETNEKTNTEEMYECHACKKWAIIHVNHEKFNGKLYDKVL